MTVKTEQPPMVTIILEPTELERLNNPPPETCRHSIEGHKMTVRPSKRFPGRYFVICAGCYEKFWVKEIFATVYQFS